METLEQIYDEKDRRLTGAKEEAEGHRGALFPNLRLLDFRA